MKFLGIAVDQTSPYKLTFISNSPINIGEYVVIVDEDRQALGIVSAVYSENPYISEGINKVEYAKKIRSLTQDSIRFRAIVNLLGEIREYGLSALKYPPKPSSDVYVADNDILKKVFNVENEKFIKIGTLLNNEEVPVYIDLSNAIIRHLAILAITGAGKSNTVGVLLERISEKNGTALIFDIHGEYKNMQGKIVKERKIKIIEPTIDPKFLDIDDISALIGIDMDSSPQMYYILGDVIEDMIKRYFSEDEEDTLSKELSKNFLNDVIKQLESIKEDREKVRSYGKESLFRLINRLKNLQNKYGSLFKDGATQMIKRIELGKINVLDLASLDEDKADVIISHILSEILADRKGNKSYIKVPIVCILEEAHLFASYRRPTKSKYILGRIVREGRKFGVGLWIVSQRPKGLDPDILSQMNNKIILKLVEPEDQAHVQRASENLSQELLEYLPSLNPGEAVLVGNMVRIPVLVKIDKAIHKVQGQDPDVIKEWSNYGINEKKRTYEY